MVNIKELNEDLELAIKKTQEANIENEGEEKFIKIPLGSTVLLAEVMALDDRGDEESLNALFEFIRDEAMVRDNTNPSTDLDQDIEVKTDLDKLEKMKTTLAQVQPKELEVVKGYSAFLVNEADKCIQKLSFRDSVPASFSFSLIDLLDKENELDFTTGVLLLLEEIDEDIDLLSSDFSNLNDFYQDCK